MKVAFVLGGTDRGRSGIGSWVRAVAPLMISALEASGGKLVAIGTREELRAYGSVLESAELVEIPTAFGRPGPNALWHLALAGRCAVKAGADVLLLPAANRRLVWDAPLPVVAVVHDLAQLRVSGKYDALRMAYVRHVVVRALRRAGSLVAVSDATRRDMTGVLPPATTIDVVPNGVDVERFQPAEASAERVRSARAWANLDGKYLLYLSRLEHPGKNHARLLEAFASSELRRSHELVLAGADWGAGPLLRARARELGVHERVRWLGFVPDEQVPGLVAAADAVIMVGLCEGFGLPALEALAAGRPVVAANAGALPEVVEDLGVLCDPLDVESIRAALERAVRDEVLRRRVESAGPVRAAGRSWHKSVTALLETCRKACAA